MAIEVILKEHVEHLGSLRTSLLPLPFDRLSQQPKSLPDLNMFSGQVARCWR